MFCRSVNDVLPDGERQRLKAYIPRLAGTVDRWSGVRGAYLALHAVRLIGAALWGYTPSLNDLAATLDRLVSGGSGVMRESGSRCSRTGKYLRHHGKRLAGGGECCGNYAGSG
jgi:hypothetical protein